MSDEVRLNVRLPAPVAAKFRLLAEERGLSYIGLVREAVGVLQTAHEGGKAGLYLGLTPHRENLQTVLVLP